MAGIFLSYSRADRAHACRIVQGFRALGVEVWWDEDMPSVDWQYELEERINEMAAVLVLWSPNSRGSRHVRDEARLADKRDKLINARIGVNEPPAPFDRINAPPIDGWDGREPHNGWRGVVQSAEAFLVKSGDAAAGSVMAALDQLEVEWHSLKEAHKQAQEEFSEAQLAAAEATEDEERAQETAFAAKQELARVGKMELEPRVLAAAMEAAQQLYEQRAAVLTEAKSSTRSARGRLSQASRKLKKLTDQLEAPVLVSNPRPDGPAPRREESADPAHIASAKALEEAQARLAAEQRLKQEQKAAEALAKAEQERLAKLADEDRQRKALEEAAAKLREEQRLKDETEAASKAERERLEAERLEAERLERERRDKLEREEGAARQQRAERERQQEEQRAAAREEWRRAINERIGAAKSMLAENRFKVLGALGVVGVALAGALMPSGENVPVQKPGGRSVTPSSAGTPNGPARVPTSPTPKPGAWLIGEWVINQAANGCGRRMNVTPGQDADQLIFEFPELPSDLSGPDGFEVQDIDTLTTTGWKYTKLSNGTITMQSRADPQQVQELSKCAS